MNSRPKIDFKVGFFCEMDLEDHNRFVINSMIAHFTQKIPIITTISLLQKIAKEYRVILFDRQGQWDFFKQKNSDFIVFLPHCLKPELDWSCKLVELDLNIESLNRVNLGALFAARPLKTTLKQFEELFLPNPQSNKLFHLVGHGSKGVIGGLTLEAYQTFLKVLAAQSTQGVIITSCFSGNHLAHRIPETRKMTIITRSIGDFEVTEDSYEVVKGPQLIQLFAQILSEKPLTKSIYQEAVRTAFPENTPYFGNSIQILFPHSKEVPAGLRPLEEDERHFHLTRTMLMQSNIESYHEWFIEQFTHVEISPLVIDKTLVFVKESPTLISMIPGQSCHFIKKIICEDISPSIFLQKTLNAYAQSNSNKGFFFGEIVAKNSSWQGVALTYYDSKFMLIFSKDGKYFHMNGMGLQEISKMDYVNFADMIQETTIPPAEALKASSGGQESKEEFISALHASFWVEDILPVMGSLLHSKTVQLDTIKVRDIASFVDELTLFFGSIETPPYLHIDRVETEHAVIEDVTILLTSGGTTVYKSGQDYYFYLHSELKKISQAHFLSIKDQIESIVD